MIYTVEIYKLRKKIHMFKENFGIPENFLKNNRTPVWETNHTHLSLMSSGLSHMNSIESTWRNTVKKTIAIVVVTKVGASLICSLLIVIARAKATAPRSPP